MTQVLLHIPKYHKWLLTVALINMVLLLLPTFAQGQLDYYPTYPKLQKNTDSLHSFTAKEVVLHPDWKAKGKVLQLKMTQWVMDATGDENTMRLEKEETLAYDESQRLKKVLVSSGDGQTSTSYELAYNTRGNIIRYQKYDNDTLQYDEKIKYNQQDLIIQEKKTTADEIITLDYERDDSGKLLAYRKRVERTGQKPTIIEYLYFYENDQLKKIEKYDTLQSLVTVDHFKYDANGNMTSHFAIYPLENNRKQAILAYDYNDEGEAISITTHTSDNYIIGYYDEKGNMTKIKYCTPKDCPSVRTRVYDDNNNVAKLKRETEEGILEVNYVYDDKGNRTQETIYVNGEQKEIHHITYDAMGKEIKRVYEYLSDDLPTLEWKNTYDYDEVGNWVKWKGYTNGEVTHETFREIIYDDDE